MSFRLLANAAAPPRAAKARAAQPPGAQKGVCSVKLKTMDKSARARLLFGCFVVLLVTVAAWMWSYVYEPVGDDILGYFDNTNYQDGGTAVGERFTSISQIPGDIIEGYMGWTGRLTSSVYLFVQLWPKFWQALVAALIYTFNILLAMRILYRDWVKVLSRPLVFVLLYLAMYWYRANVSYIYFRTFVKNYSLSALLPLLYFNLAVTDRENGKQRPVWVLTLFGLMAGLCHEVLSFCMIVAVGTVWLINVLRKKEKWTSVFRHVGYGVGYLICFFAPGNFQRMQLPHDAPLLERPYLARLKDAFWMHKYVFVGQMPARLLLYACILLAAVSLLLMLYQRRRDALCRVLEDVAPFLTAGTASLLVWGVASYCPPYGMELFMLLVYGTLLRFIIELPLFTEWKPWGACSMACTAAVLVAFAFANHAEIESYCSVSLERQALIKQAVENGEAEVEIPMYDENLSPHRYQLNYLNNQEQYDLPCYTAYYGTHLVLKSSD